MMHAHTSRLQWLLAALMLSLALIAWGLRPNQRMSEQQQTIQLSALIPVAFADWREEVAAQQLLVDPTVSQTLKKVYLQTLSRTYRNAQGQQVMLSIAYGGDQNDMMQVHKPEICYTAQGFQITESHDAVLRSGQGQIGVRELLAVKGARQEPITYWVTIGNTVTVNPLQWRIERIRYGLTGVVPDGLLFRVSSLGEQPAQAYALQRRFIDALMQAVTPETRARLMGTIQPLS